MITIKRGEDYTKHLLFQYADTLNPVDLTGCDAYCQMRKVPAGELLATAICSFLNYTDGYILFSFSSEQTANLPLGRCGLDVWITENGRKHPVYASECEIIDGYTDISNIF